MQVAIRIIEEPHAAGETIQFAAPSVLLVGRHSDCDLRLEGDLVSRKHARILLGATSFIVEDLSANGTEVPPNLVLHGERKELDYGAQLRIGPFELTVGDVPAALNSRPTALPPARGVAPSFVDATGGPAAAPTAAPSALAAPPIALAADTGSFAVVPPAASDARLAETTLSGDTFGRTLSALFAPLRALLEDPTVTAVLINGPGQVFVEQKGLILRTDARFTTPRALFSTLKGAAQHFSRRVDDDSVILDGRLPDGTHLVAVLPPAARGGPYATIRRGIRERFSLNRLVTVGTLSAGAAELLRTLLLARQTIVLSGGASSGKTTLLAALADCIPEDDRVVVVEAREELALDHDHVVTLDASRHEPTRRADVGVRDLLRVALDMRPDRLIVGDVLGAEALDLVNALTSGHDAGLFTVQARGPRDVVSRLETMASMAHQGIPPLAMRSQIAAAVDVIVQLARLRDGSRKVTHVTEIAGFDVGREAFWLRDLYVRKVNGVDIDGGVVSDFGPTGILPTKLEQLLTQGYDLPREMYDAAARTPAVPQPPPDPT